MIVSEQRTLNNPQHSLPSVRLKCHYVPTPGEAACNVQTLSSSVLFIRYLASVPHKHFSDKSLVSRPAPRPPSPRCCRQSPESHSWGSFLMIQTRSPADMLVMFDNWMIGSNSGSSRLKLLKITYGQAVVRNPLW